MKGSMGLGSRAGHSGYRVQWMCVCVCGGVAACLQIPHLLLGTALGT